MHFILCSTQYLARSIQYLVCCCSNVKQAFQPTVYLSDLKVKPSHFKRRLTLLFSTYTLHTVWGKAVKCLSRCLPPTPTPPVLQGGVRVQWDSTPLEYIFVRLQSKQLKFRKEFLKRIYEKTSIRDTEMSSTLRDLKQSHPTTGPCSATVSRMNAPSDGIRGPKQLLSRTNSKVSQRRQKTQLRGERKRMWESPSIAFPRRKSGRSTTAHKEVFSWTLGSWKWRTGRSNDRVVKKKVRPQEGLSQKQSEKL